MAVNHLPLDSRIWIFGADRHLSKDEESALQSDLQNFVSGWQAHGKDLSAGFEIQNGCLVVIAVDENAEVPSGCSIDKAFRLLQEFGLKNKLDFFKRTNIYLKRAEGIEIYSKEAALDAWKKGFISNHDTIVQTLHANLAGFLNHPFVNISESWLAKIPV